MSGHSSSFLVWLRLCATVFKCVFANMVACSMSDLLALPCKYVMRSPASGPITCQIATSTGMSFRNSPRACQAEKTGSNRADTSWSRLPSPSGPIRKTSDANALARGVDHVATMFPNICGIAICIGTFSNITEVPALANRSGPASFRRASNISCLLLKWA